MDNVALGRALIEAIDAEDLQRIRSLYANDAVIWHDFDGLEQDVDTNIQSLLNLRKAIPSVRWEINRCEPLPHGFLLTYELVASFDQKTLRVPSCVIGSVADGAVTRIEEWVNATPLYKYLSPEQLGILTGA